MNVNFTVNRKLVINIEQELLEELGNVATVKTNPFKGHCDKLCLQWSVDTIIDMMKEVIIHAGKSAHLLYNQIKLIEK